LSGLMTCETLTPISFPTFDIEAASCLASFCVLIVAPFPNFTSRTSRSSFACELFAHDAGCDQGMGWNRPSHIT
jgi:hypothetical protein